MIPLSESSLIAIALLSLLAMLLYPIGSFVVVRFMTYFSRKYTLCEDRAKAMKIVGSDAFYGKYIGFFEVTFVFIAVCINQYQIPMIAVLIKSLARHSELSDKIYSSVFLIGTFSSILWGLIVSLFFKALILYAEYEPIVEIKCFLTKSGLLQ